MIDTALTIVDVFVSAQGTGGNRLGVFLDGGDVPRDERQAVAADLGFAETVFVDDAGSGQIEIYTPTSELRFAGHPTVGASDVLRRAGRAVTELQVGAGSVPTWFDGELTWVRGRPEWAPSMRLEQLATARDVDALKGAPDGVGVLYAWAWLDSFEGRVRARMFGPALGIAEDEATGSAAIALAGSLRRPLQIRQGRGSVLLAKPQPDGSVALGGRVRDVAQRRYRSPDLDTEPFPRVTNLRVDCAATAASA